MEDVSVWFRSLLLLREPEDDDGLGISSDSSVVTDASGPSPIAATAAPL